MKRNVTGVKAGLLFAMAGLVLPAQTIAAILPEKDAVAVSELVQESLKAQDLSVSFVAEGKFAIAFWKAADGHAGGEALAKKTAGNWVIVKQTSGTFKSAQTLEALGVPANQAKALVADLATAGQ